MSDSVSAAELLRTQGSAVVPRLSTEMMFDGDSESARAMRSLLDDAGDDSELLSRKRIAILATDGVEEVELTIPIGYLRKRGATVDLVAPPKPVFPPGIPIQMPDVRETHILTIRYMENAGWVKFDRLLADIDAISYDAVIVPGGAWNPDNLRLEKAALAFLRAMHAAGKTVAALCHGPLVLVNAGLVRDKRATCYWNVMEDLKNAGAEVSDEPLVIDGNLITSRFPLDLPSFLPAIVEAVVAG